MYSIKCVWGSITEFRKRQAWLHAVCMLTYLYSTCIGMSDITCACLAVGVYSIYLNMVHVRGCDVRVLHGHLWEQVHLLNCEHIYLCTGKISVLKHWWKSSTLMQHIISDTTSGMNISVTWWIWDIWSQAGGQRMNYYGIFTAKHFACRGSISLVSI